MLVNEERVIRPELTILINPKMDTGSLYPAYWKPHAGNMVVAMNSEERAQRDRDIAKYGVDNDVFVKVIVPELPPSPPPLVVEELFLSLNPKDIVRSMNGSQRALYYVTIIYLLTLLFISVTANIIHK